MGGGGGTAPAFKTIKLLLKTNRAQEEEKKSKGAKSISEQNRGGIHTEGEMDQYI